MTPKFHALQIEDVRQETEDTVSVAFSVPNDLISAYQYNAGQYLTLKATINGEEVRRSYSICTAPHENELRVAIKRVENGLFSTWATQELKAGQSMDVMTPMGNFQLTPSVSSTKNYVLFAAGSGVTPIISIAKTILTQEPNSRVTMVYGNKGFASIIFREEIEALKNTYMTRFRLVHILSRESLGNKLQKGRIDEDKVSAVYKAFLQNESIDGVYICGPESMIHAVKNGLSSHGVAENNIHFELFGTNQAAIKKEEKKDDSKVVLAKVTIIMDDDHFDFDLSSNDTSILEAGHQAGADLPFACKGGVCCTCKAKILEGSAVMDVNYALEKDEVEAGYILTCQAHPTSEKLVVSFDD
jgi:ring-1,2-phenylacetyl-CoA epoxidase subunit PaaE